MFSLSAYADDPPKNVPDPTKLPQSLPQGPSVNLAGTQVSAQDVVLAVVPDEVKQLIPDPDKLAEWFQGHGGAILGTGTMVVAPLGFAAGGDQNAMTRSHLPGIGLHGQIGMLFLRRWGVLGHAGYAEHLKGTDKPSSATSWNIGASGMFLFKPEKKTPYLEFGITRSSFSSDVSVPGGIATRTAASFDYRLGLGYLVLTEAQKFLYTPWVAVDFGRFGSIDQSLNGNDSTVDLGDRKAWHYVISAGITFAYHKKIPGLVGPVPKERPDDKDGDLILDAYDKCPLVKEDYYPPDPKDGCPSDDWDQDGFLNKDDKCPTIPEDGLPPDAKDGCPTTDRDQDGVPDVRDKCPTKKEDGLPPFPDDGCPASEAKDRDHDGVVDDEDACPDTPGVKTTDPKTNGCPAEQPRVKVDQKEITIREAIYFEAGSATISERSVSLVDDIAKALKASPQVELVEIQGHADNVGAPDTNVRLTQLRAMSVRKTLIDRGVEPSRLVAVGYGEYCPIEANQPGRQGNEKNRRVEFRILRTSAGPTGAEAACAEAVKHGIKGSDPNAKGPSK